jgi:hypothetical protein
MSNVPNAAEIAQGLRTILDRENAKRQSEQQAQKERDELQALKAEMASIVQALRGKQEPADPVQALRQDLEAFRQELTQLKTEREQHSREAMLGQIREQVVSDLRGRKDGYELIRATGAEDLVFQTIVTHFQTTGKMLTAEEAATQVEKNLSDQVDKVIALESVKKRLNGGTVTPSTGNAETPPGLNNSVSSTTASAVEAPPHVGLPGPAQIAAALKKHGLE